MSYLFSQKTLWNASVRGAFLERQKAVRKLCLYLNTSSKMVHSHKTSPNIPMSPWHPGIYTLLCVLFWSCSLGEDSLLCVEVSAKKLQRPALFPGARPVRQYRHCHTLPLKAGNQKDSSKSVFVQPLRKYPVCRLVGVSGNSTASTLWTQNGGCPWLSRVLALNTLINLTCPALFWFH